MVPRFFLLRHGRSLANDQGVIASRPVNAAEAYGLTAVGREQVRSSVSGARGTGRLAGPFFLASSPLLRTRESAETAGEALGVTPVVDPRLTERDFGDFEVTSDENYRRVWQADLLDPTHRRWGVESVVSVLRRARAVVADLARDGRAPTVVLCTHGDVASTLLCASLGLPLGRHREVGAMEPGALRELTSVEALLGGHA